MYLLLKFIGIKITIFSQSDQRSKKLSIRLHNTSYFVFPSGILAQAPYNSSIPVSFYLLGGCFSKNLMHSWKSLIISSTFELFNGVNEKWKHNGCWFSDKCHFLSFMNFWIVPNEYFGWSKPIQQIFGSP